MPRIATGVSALHRAHSQTMTAPCPQRRISVAPMMERTDRPFRRMIRQVTRCSLLYTEMITARALLSEGAGPYQQKVHPAEHPVALQLGGDNPSDLAKCAIIAQDLGYDEVNLNVGCPSSRVRQGRIGAVLMREPDHVAECLAAMQSKVKIPVTVKHRLGVDDDPDEALTRFVEAVAKSGTRHFTVHARKAWLQGLSPKENRSIPPLRYELVHALAQAYPHLSIEINGGIKTLDACQTHLAKVSSVMIGRGAWDDPLMLQDVDRRFYGAPNPNQDAMQIAAAMVPVIEESVAKGHAWSHALRPILNLMHGRPGGRRWRRALSQGSANPSDPSIAHLVHRVIEQMRHDPGVSEP